MFRLADSWVMSRGPQSTQGILRPTVTCRLAGQAASPVGRKLEIGGAHRLQFCPNGYSLESRLSFTTPAPSQGQNAPAPKRCGVDAAFPFMRQAFLAAKRGTLAGRFARQRRTPGCGWRRRESAPKKSASRINGPGQGSLHYGSVENNKRLLWEVYCGRARAAQAAESQF